MWNEKAREDFFINRLPAGLTPRAYNLRIVSEIEMKHGLPAGSIMSRQSSRLIAKARSQAIAAIRNEHPHWTLMRLGRFFKRDHSTIIHYLKREGVWKEADYGPKWSKKMAALKAALAVGNTTEE